MRGSNQQSRDAYDAGVVVQLEVRLGAARLWRFGLSEVGRLAQMVVVQLLLECLLGRLRHQVFLLQDRQDAQRLRTLQRTERRVAFD